MRRISLERLADALIELPENPRVVVSGNAAAPWILLDAFDKQVSHYRLHMLNAQVGIPDRDGVVHETVFVGAGMRNSARLDYVPCRLSLVPKLLSTARPADVVLLHTSKAYDGKVSLGIEVNVIPAVIATVKQRGGLIIGQVNEQMPYTFGDGEIDLDVFDYIIEVDTPVDAHPIPPLTDTAREIGDRIAFKVLDGSTLQMGIGAIPNAFLSAVAQERTNLKVWTEMFSDGVLELESRDRLDKETPIRASFAFGSPELYRWMDRNPRIHMLKTEKTNNPAKVADQPMMTSVNAALQVDLLDQANASRIGNKIYSGFGGSTDFIVGAMHAKGGQAFIALPSWHPKANCSTIVPLLTEPTTHFQHSAIVTEQGMAAMFGRSQREQASSLIANCAHPDAREYLWEQGRRLGFVE